MKLPPLDYDRTPFLIIWEATQACDLACLHCRACARPERDPGELSTEEGEELLRETARMGTPIFIISGGDPLQRDDLYRLIRTGADLGLRMATIPAATNRLTEDVARRLKEAGLSQMALSLGVVFWEVFFLVPMGRGSRLNGLSAAQCEDLFGVSLRIARGRSLSERLSADPGRQRARTASG